jgi:hypothetical protein
MFPWSFLWDSSTRRNNHLKVHEARLADRVAVSRRVSPSVIANPSSPTTWKTRSWIEPVGWSRQYRSAGRDRVGEDITAWAARGLGGGR